MAIFRFDAGQSPNRDSMRYFYGLRTEDLGFKEGAPVKETNLARPKDSPAN